MHSGGLELTNLTYNTRLEDNLIRHRGDRLDDVLRLSLGKLLVNLLVKRTNTPLIP